MSAAAEFRDGAWRAICSEQGVRFVFGAFDSDTAALKAASAYVQRRQEVTRT